jgi:hypothetical protein
MKKRDEGVRIKGTSKNPLSLRERVFVPLLIEPTDG